MNKSTIFIIIAILLVFILLLAINSTTTNQKSNQTKAEQIKNQETGNVSIIESQLEQYKITGIVKNTTNKTIKKVVIHANCYDKDNNLTSQPITMIENLKSNETWKFSIFSGIGVEKYNLTLQTE